MTTQSVTSTHLRAPSIYTVGGTVQAGSGLYIQRRADDELYARCQAGDFTYILSARQMGKSSLMVRTAQRLQEEDTACVIVDLNELGVMSSRDEWYLGLLLRIGSRLGLRANLIQWWQEQEQMGITQRLVEFFQSVVLTEKTEPVVIFIDEIDSTLSLDFTDDFFAAIRYLYNARAVEPELKRLSFVLIGVATPGDLISDPRRTPFNIGQRLDLEDFTMEDAAPLAAGLSSSSAVAQAYLQSALAWTGGHPYLTQRLCAALANHNGNFAPAMEDHAPTTNGAATDGSISATTGSPALDESKVRADVDHVVHEIFLGEDSSRDNNLQFVSDMLTRRAPDVIAVLQLYEAVRLSNRPVPVQEQSLIHSHLRLSGVVRRVGDHLQVRNRIYAQVFDRDWIRSQRPVSWWTLLPREVKIAAGLVVLMLVALVIALIYAGQQQQQVRAANLELGRVNDDLVAEISLRSTAEAEAVENANLAAARAGDAQSAQEEAEIQYRRAEQQTLVATARLLAAHARGQALAEPDLALLLALESSRIANELTTPADTDSEAALAAVLENHPLLAAFLHGHTAGVRSVAVHPNGRVVATGGHDDRIIFWDLESRRPIGEPLQQDDVGAVEHLAFNTDGSRLVSTNQAGAVVIWDVAERTPLLPPMFGHEDRVWTADFSPDGTLLMSGSRDGTIRLWDATTGEPLSDAILAHPVGVRSVVFSPDGQRIASGGDDSNVQIWEVNTVDPNGAPLQGHEDTVTNVAFSPDGSRLASSSYDGTIRLWDVETGEADGEPLEAHTDQVWQIAFGPDGNTLASASKDGTVLIWDLEERAPMHMPLRGHRDSVRSVSFTPNGEYLLSAGEDGNVILWRLDGEHDEHIRLTGQPGDIRSVAVSPAGDQFVTGDEDGAIYRWNATDYTHIGTLSGTEGHKGRIWQLAYRTDGKLLASAGNDKSVRLWDMQAGAPFAPALQGHKEAVISLAFHPEQAILASGDRSGAILLWDLDSGTARGAPLIGHTDRIWRLAFDATGERLISAARDGTVRVWDVASGAQLGDPLGTPDRAAESAAFLPEAHIVALGRKNGAVSILDLASGAPLHDATGDGKIALESVALSQDGTWLAAGDQEGNIQLWQLTEDGQTQHTGLLGRHNGVVRSLVFTPDGKHLISTGADGLIGVWSLQPSSQAAHACRMANRNLTQAEWQRFLGTEIPYHETCPA